jgi:threonine/homoserine/homoserine lactone efflux protein
MAVLALSLTPGPNSLLVLTQGASHGHRHTRWTVLGGAVGFFLVISIAMLGLGALLEDSGLVLRAMKWCGGLYLVWLGIQTWRTPLAPILEISNARNTNRQRSFQQGLLAAAFNPKVILFFTAFLPQFIDPNFSLIHQWMVMALTFVIIEATVEYGLAMLANRVRPWLNQNGKRFNQYCGCLFAVMGTALPMTK